MTCNGTFTTSSLHSHNKPQTQNSKDITLATPYNFPADVAIGLNQLNIGHHANIRVKAYASKVTNIDFTANIDTWRDTVLHTAACDWLALDPMDQDFAVGEYSTKNDHPSSQRQEKTSSRIDFAVPFLKTPNVVCFLKMIDLNKDRNYRIKTYATKIDAKGFTIHIDTWDDSILYSAIAGYVAYNPDRKQFFSGTASTKDVRPSSDHRAQTGKHIVFTGTNFTDNPNVFMALNKIDARHGHNLRVKCYSESVSARGMSWHIDSWHDTVLFSAGVSYICYL